ncbi:hypothetical protein BJY01DRAFT_202930 [Aspergillus pseudoustus]|uniref:Uncharacterized protein n=1 Tax=Aspergillus pseudoustus TaxID=1810923 RepID=A0ABR4KY03_9EURO
MKLTIFASLAFGKTLVLILSACIVTSAISFESIISDLQRNVFGRSLPGSLAQAPEGAVGDYQPPPGPVIYGSSPIETGEIPKGTASAPMAGSTNDRKIQSSTDAVEDNNNNLDDPRKHIAPVSEMDAFIRKTYTASASRGVMQSLAIVVTSILISLLHL